MESRGPANFIPAILCLQVRTCVLCIDPGLIYPRIFCIATGAASSHLQHLDHLQIQIQLTYCSTFQLLSHHCNAGLICRVTILSFVMLIILIANLVTFIPGILLCTCTLLIHVTLKLLTDSDVVGRLQL